MKKKLLLFFLLIASFAYDVSATVIIIGGTRNHRFRVVKKTDRLILCKGAGNNVCPVGWFEVSPEAIASQVFPLDKVTQYVLDMVNTGQKEGEIKYEDALPVRWTTLADESVQIEVDDSGLKEIPGHE